MSKYMSYFSPTVLFFSLGLMLGLSVAHADTTIMKVTGNIKASPCSVNAPPSGVNVALGNNILANSLSVAGTGSSWKSFAIDVTGCPVSTTGVTMTLSGTPDTTQTDMFANTGSAAKAQIQLQNIGDGSTLGNGSTIVQPVIAGTYGTTFNLQARAYTAQGGVTPGTLVGVVMATFTYQ